MMYWYVDFLRTGRAQASKGIPVDRWFVFRDWRAYHVSRHDNLTVSPAMPRPSIIVTSRLMLCPFHNCDIMARARKLSWLSAEHLPNSSYPKLCCHPWRQPRSSSCHSSEGCYIGVQSEGAEGHQIHNFGLPTTNITWIEKKAITHE
jgi:hypothetical protein